MQRLWALAAAALLLGDGAASGQTVNEVVEKHLAANGGREALSKLTSRKVTGTLTITTPVGELPGTIEMVNQAPNRERTLITIDLSSVGAAQMTFDQRFDGTAGYVIDSLQGNREITGNQLEAMKNAAFPDALLDYARRGMAVELAGREAVGGRDTYVLVLRPKSGPTVRQFIDAETFLIARTVTTIDAVQVGPLEQTTDFSDYRDVDGVKFPFVVKTSTSVQTLTATITSVEHNVTIDPALFSKPAN